MAGASLVVIVEGIDDHLFYDKMVAQYLKEAGSGRTFQIRTPREVNAGADGKNAAINIFKIFRSRGKLSSSGGSKKTLFFVDQDYDGIARRKLKSFHLVYTPSVSFENCLYDLGDVSSSVEALISRRVNRAVFVPDVDYESWKVTCARSWRDWIIYCVACELSGVATRKNRSGLSSIHSGVPPALNVGQPDGIFEEFVHGVGDRVKAVEIWGRSQRLVDRSIRNDINKVFCGKWLAHFLSMEVKSLGGAFDALSSRVSSGRTLMAQLIRGLEFSGPVKRYYFEALDSVLI